LCYSVMSNVDVCEGTSLLCPKANFADWSHHCPPFPLSIASVPSFPVQWDDGCPGENPTPVSYCDPNDCQMAFGPQPILDLKAVRDFQVSLARESAEYFGYILNHKRNLEIEIVEARNLSGSNTHCIVSLDTQKFQTPVVFKTSHPIWNSKFFLTVRDYNEEKKIKIKMKTKSTFLKNMIGGCSIRPSDMHEMELYDQWIPLEREDSKSEVGEVRIRSILGNPSLDSVIFNITQKGFSSQFAVFEEMGNCIFSMEGKDDLHFLIDRFGTRVFDIRRRDTSRKVFQAEPVFDVYQAGTDRMLATVSRKVQLLKVEFFIEIMGERVISQRDKWNSNITLVKEDGSFVCFIKKPTISNKTMSVEIAPKENIPLILTLAAYINVEDTQISD